MIALIVALLAFGLALYNLVAEYKMKQRIKEMNRRVNQANGFPSASAALGARFADAPSRSESMLGEKFD
jgi:uncharacterized membrane protein YjfL (UPF0719 family)